MVSKLQIRKVLQIWVPELLQLSTLQVRVRVAILKWLLQVSLVVNIVIELQVTAGE